MKKKVLITCDPYWEWKLEFDSTFLIIKELHNRGFEIDLIQTDKDFLESKQINLYSITQVNFETEDPKLCLEAKVTQLNVVDSWYENYFCVFNRKNPPVDKIYKALAALTENFPKEILQINHPNAVFGNHEHLLPVEFPEFSPETKHCVGGESIYSFVTDLGLTRFVCKPLTSYGGKGVEIFEYSKLMLPLLQDYCVKWGQNVVVQRYLPEIVDGDLRVVVFFNEIIGTVLRVPDESIGLGNLHSGAIAQKGVVNEAKQKAINEIAPKLTKRGLYFLGFDFIGDKISEINFTSPTTLVQINNLFGINCEKKLLDVLLSKTVDY